MVKPTQPAADRYNYAWWSDTNENAHGTLFANLDTIRQAQNNRIQTSLRFDSLYDGIDYLGLTQSWAGQAGRQRQPPISFNATRIVGDTLHSKLIEGLTKVTFLTDGGNWADRKKAEVLERFVAGEMYRTKFYRLCDQAFSNAIRHGNGYLKFFNEEGRVKVECPHPLEIYVDEAETWANKSSPRQMYQERFVNREVLLSLYPDKVDAIMASSAVGDTQYHYFTMHVGEIVRVIEAWHLESTPGKGDGKHIIAVESGTLFEEDWTRQGFPFAMFQLYERGRGYYGIGLVERLLEQQAMCNRLIRRAFAAMHLLCAPFFLIEAGSRVCRSHFNTDIGNIVEFLGTPPTLMVNNPVPSDITNYIQQLIQWMFLSAGINELEAGGKKPDGLDSGRAIRAFTDKADLRHVSILNRSEEFILDSADCILEAVREIAAETGDYQTFGHFKDHARLINWSDLDLDKEAYVMKMANINMLPSTPSGKLQAVQDLAQAGVLTPIQAVRGLESPDIDAITADLTAPEEDLEWTIYQMTKPKDARYMAPEPFQDLRAGIMKVTNALLQERNNEAPEEIMDNLRRWIRDADNELQAQQQAVQQQQMQQQQQQMGMQIQAQQAQQAHAVQTQTEGKALLQKHQAALDQHGATHDAQIAHIQGLTQAPPGQPPAGPPQ